MHNGMAKVGDTVYRISCGAECELSTFVVTQISKGKNTIYDILHCKCIASEFEERRECIYYHLSAKVAWQTVFDIEDKALKYIEQQIKFKIKMLERIKEEIDKL